VHTLHETSEKLRHLTAATIILNWPVPGHGGEGSCDKGLRGRYPTRAEPSQAVPLDCGAVGGPRRQLMVRRVHREGVLGSSAAAEGAAGHSSSRAEEKRPPFKYPSMEGLWW